MNEMVSLVTEQPYNIRSNQVEEFEAIFKRWRRDVKRWQI